jgi:ribosomal protein S18 acetylase RimI-like enzyme
MSMEWQIRLLRDTDIEDLVQLSLLAWMPVFESFQQVLGPDIYAQIWPDWRALQTALVEEVCQDGEKTIVGVAEVDAAAVGFVAYRLNAQDKTGQVYLLAVHPDYQNRGIGTALNNWALERMKASGMNLASVETGGDPSHAPARRSYEKAGFTPMPQVRYYKDLTGS